MMEKGHNIPLLDHGYVKLIDWMGTDETIVEAARMSTGRGFISWDPYPGRPEDGDAGFLEFLLQNNHTSPFEQCELAIEVQAPIFVFREWHRHRTQSYNEFSARYSQMPNLHYLPETLRFIPVVTKNKQASGATDKEVTIDAADEARDDLVADQGRVYRLYEDHLKMGIPKEIARINTPVSRYSKMRAKTDLWNWLRFLNLRQRPNAMWEIRQFADAVASIVKELYPRTFFLYEEYMLHAVSFSRSEMVVLKNLLSDLSPTTEMAAGIGHLSEKKLKALIAKLR
jgi:thymidylate synthase (FAD)